MRLHAIPSPFYVVSGLVLVPSGVGAALVVDPPVGTQHLIREVFELEGVSVGTVLLTYGYPDHAWDVTTVSTWGVDGGIVPVYMPGPDTYHMNVLVSFLLMPLPNFVGEWAKLADPCEVLSDSSEVYPGAWLRMIPAPGHTEGSAVLLGESPFDIRVNSQSFYRSGEAAPRAMSADVLSKDSVGRADLPRSDETQIRHSLRTISNALDPRTILVPGHGPAITPADGIRSSQYLIRARRIG